MSYVLVDPETLAAASASVQNIGSAVSEANSAAAQATTGVVAAAGDEVSAAVASLFSSHGQEYQALSAQAASFHAQFVQLMHGGASEYALAEAANVSPLQTVEQDLLSGAGELHRVSIARTGSCVGCGKHRQVRRRRAAVRHRGRRRLDQVSHRRDQPGRGIFGQN